MSSMAEGLKGECKCCVGGAHKGVMESLDEMDFQRSLAGAAQAGDVGRMRRLLARGAKVDGDGDSGYAPLHYAPPAWPCPSLPSPPSERCSSGQEDSSRASYKSAPGSVCGTHRGGEGSVATRRKCGSAR